MPITFKSMDFLLQRMNIGRRKPCCLDRLTNDILVDQIFSYLDAKQILRMRRVSKLYYYLSQTPAIWKRLLKSIDYPLPPVPPTSRHSLAKLSGFEVERLLVRPLSLDRAWQAEVPDCYDEWKFNAHHRVKSMVILPGGQYLVASVSDHSGKYHAIMLWMLDHAYAPAVPLAKTPVSTKAYHLQAKYLTLGGRRGITISYVCRGFKHRSDAKKGIDLSEYSGDYDVDPPYPLVYECTVLHAPLAALESIGDPRFVPGTQAFIDHAKTQPPPFRRIAMIRSTRSLGPGTMDEIWGSPYLAIVRRPNTIMFKNLDGGAVSTLTPTPAEPALAQCILAMRMLPNQNQILVVRKVTNVPPDRSDRDVFPLEMFDIPVNLTGVAFDETRAPVERVFILDDEMAQVSITDHYIPTHDDESLNKHVFGSDSKPPQPISIIARSINPEGMIRCTIYPEKVRHAFPPSPPNSASSSTSRSPSPVNIKQVVRYKYSVRTCSPIRYVASPAGTVYRILPGSYRSVVYTVPKDDRTDTPYVVCMKRYWDDECLKRPTIEQLSDPDYYNKPRRALRKFGYDMTGEVGMSAMAWDETIGRLCMIVEKSSRVWVLDFAKAPKEDHFGRRLPLCLPVEEARMEEIEEVEEIPRFPANDEQNDSDSEDEQNDTNDVYNALGLMV